jgi:hypothetical protein
MYPAEFLPSEDPGEGARALERLASATGGRVVVSVAGLWSGLEGRPRRRELAPGLYLLAAALFLALVWRRLRGGAPSRFASGPVPGAVAEKAGERPGPPAAAVPSRGSALRRAKRRAGV